MKAPMRVRVRVLLAGLVLGACCTMVQAVPSALECATDATTRLDPAHKQQVMGGVPTLPPAGTNVTVTLKLGWAGNLTLSVTLPQ